jgi:hypothetical protein
MTRKARGGFIIKVTLIHVLTYVVCGIVFSQIFGYQDALVNNTTMRGMDDPFVMAAPLFQIVRGLLFGVVLLWIKDAFLGKKFGWLRLWAIVLILSVFNTPAPSPGSIEGFIYLLPTDEPLVLQIGGTLEILLQTLLVSVLVTLKRLRRQRSEMEENVTEAGAS